jgi:hypothetical protein
MTMPIRKPIRHSCHYDRSVVSGETCAKLKFGRQNRV